MPRNTEVLFEAYEFKSLECSDCRKTGELHYYCGSSDEYFCRDCGIEAVKRYVSEDEDDRLFG